MTDKHEREEQIREEALNRAKEIFEKTLNGEEITPDYNPQEFLDKCFFEGETPTQTAEERSKKGEEAFLSILELLSRPKTYYSELNTQKILEKPMIKNKITLPAKLGRLMGLILICLFFYALENRLEKFGYSSLLITMSILSIAFLLSLVHVYFWIKSDAKASIR